MFHPALFSRHCKGGGGSTPTCVDVVGQPQESLFDFTGLTGASFEQDNAPGLYVEFFDGAGNLYYAWASTGNNESDPAPAGGTGTRFTVNISSSASDCAFALASVVQANFGTTFSTSNSSAQTTISTVADVNCKPSNAGTSPIAVTNTQLGYPTATICSPTSDALAGISFARRFQRTFLGVGYNASLGGKPAYTTNLLNGSPALFQDTARTIPAVSQGDTVMAMIDPDGNTATQTNSMNALILTFVQGANGMYYPTLTGSGSGFFAIDTLFYPGSNWVAFHGFKRNSGSSPSIVGFADISANGPYSLAYSSGIIYFHNLPGYVSASYSATSWDDWIVANTADSISVTNNGSPFSTSPTTSAAAGSQFSDLYKNDGFDILDGGAVYDAVTSGPLSSGDLATCSTYFPSLKPWA